ncbi:MAG TPA: nuclear transport factor 2 family protein [Solirubrobacteraceae bacterium]|nr:nuclear transport factor 2 family protein [Solirubrobacteraceae bacterium]
MPGDATAPDTVELARELLETGHRGEWDRAMEFFSPRAVWVAIDAIEAFEGPAMRDFWIEWYSAYEDVHIEIVDLVDLGGGLVMAVIHQSGRFGDAPTRITQDATLLYEWSSGLVDRVTSYARPDEARAAAERLLEERA